MLWPTFVRISAAPGLSATPGLCHSPANPCSRHATGALNTGLVPIRGDHSMSKLERTAAISHFPDSTARTGNRMSADGRGRVTSRLLRHGVVSTLVISLLAASSAVAGPVASALDQVPFQATFSDQFVATA